MGTHSKPGRFHEQRSLVGYSPWGPKESDMTEQWNINFLGQGEVQVGKESE